MIGPGQDNAMTEIALALAMAFFAIMVLALISMGAEPNAGSAVLSAGVPARASADEASPGADAVPPEQLVVYYDNQFLDANLRPFDPLHAAHSWPAAAVLAVPPDLPLAKVLSVRRRLAPAEPTVTILDDRWLERLRETRP